MLLNPYSNSITSEDPAFIRTSAHIHPLELMLACGSASPSDLLLHSVREIDFLEINNKKKRKFVRYVSRHHSNTYTVTLEHIASSLIKRNREYYNTLYYILFVFHVLLLFHNILVVTQLNSELTLPRFLPDVTHSSLPVLAAYSTSKHGCLL